MIPAVYRIFFLRHLEITVVPTQWTSARTFGIHDAVCMFPKLLRSFPGRFRGDGCYAAVRSWSVELVAEVPVSAVLLFWRYGFVDINAGLEDFEEGF